MGIIQSTSEIAVDDSGKEIMEDFRVFPMIVNDGDIHQFIGGCITAHWHPEWEIYVQQDGEALLDIQGERITLSPGEGCFINSGILHCFRAKNEHPCRYRSFVFDSSLVAGVPGSVFDLTYVTPVKKTGPTFLKLEQTEENAPYFTAFQRAFLACVLMEPGYEFQVRDAFSEITLFLCGKTERSPQRASESIQEMHIKEMMSWMESHLTEPLTLKEIAASVHLSPRECQRIFKAYLHRTPMEYLQWRRILAAADDLRNTNEEIMTIALNYQFSLPGYFSKRFKSYTGLTPTEYRR